jgi:hypothetical protein
MSVSPLKPAEPEPLRYARKIRMLASWPPSSSMGVGPIVSGVAPCAREATERQGCGEKKQVAVAAGSQNPPFLDSYQAVNWNSSFLEWHVSEFMLRKHVEATTSIIIISNSHPCTPYSAGVSFYVDSEL